MKLDKSPFVVVSVIGQELLTHGFHGAAVVVLEAGLKIGTCSLKLRGSVFSALSSAYWSLGNTEKSMAYMQQDLEVTKTLGTKGETRRRLRFCKAKQFVMKVPPTGDQAGECRAHGNLGSALFSKGSFREALANHRNQLVLAMKLKDREVRPRVCSVKHGALACFYGETHTGELLGSVLINSLTVNSICVIFFC